MKKTKRIIQVSPAKVLESILVRMDLVTLKNMIEKLTALHESKCLDEIERTK